MGKSLSFLFRLFFFCIFFTLFKMFFFSHLLKLLSNSHLALQASNLTSEDLTLTVPASFTSPPSVGSLTSNLILGLSESAGIITGEKYGSAVQALSSVTTMSENMKWNSDGGVQSVSFIEQSSPISDVISSTGLGCTHLWLQSRVPLGCVPVQSTTTIKLELLPLTDGIISLDTLQIDVKEKGIINLHISWIS
ncbi:hypothetical protein Peur_004941 [Populus x canadensis]